MKNNKGIISSISIFILLAAFLWVTNSVLSPLLVGGLLLFLLYSLKEKPFTKPLAFCVILILVFWIVLQIKGILFPILISLLLAYLFDPLTDWMEARKIPRAAAAFFLLLLAFGIIILFGVILIPNLISEIETLINKLPALTDKISHTLRKNLIKLSQIFHIDSDTLQNIALQQGPQKAEKILSNILKGITNFGSLLGQIIYVFLIPVLTFYLLKDFDNIRRWLLSYIPEQHREPCSFYGGRFNKILGGYIRGQIIVCSIFGILIGTGLTLFNLPFALLIGVLTGLLNIIPYIGFYISLALALLTSFLTPNIFISMLKIGGIFIIVQVLDAYVVSPKIIGKKVGLHPAAVIISILVFSEFFGFWGLIIGVPTAAVIKFLMDEWKGHQERKNLYNEKESADN